MTGNGNVKLESTLNVSGSETVYMFFFFPLAGKGNEILKMKFQLGNCKKIMQR